jgi:hypothetical protein
MNVLIVDKDKKFTSNLFKILTSSFPNVDTEISSDFYFSENDCSSCKKYDVAIIDIDTVGNDVAEFAKCFSNSKIIGLTSNVNLIPKIINKPFIHRLFLKPVNSKEIVDFIKIQNKIKNSKRGVISSKNNVFNMLVELGFKGNQSGTRFLADSIWISITKGIVKLKEIYYELGNQIGVPENAINWAINYSIEQVNNDVRNDRLYRFFNVYKEKRVTAKTIIEFFVASN